MKASSVLTSKLTTNLTLQSNINPGINSNQDRGLGAEMKRPFSSLFTSRGTRLIDWRKSSGIQDVYICILVTMP